MYYYFSRKVKNACIFGDEDEILTLLNGTFSGFIDLREAMKWACIHGNLKIVKIIENMTKNKLVFDSWAFYACKGGKEEVINYFSTEAKNIKNCFLYICCSDNLDLFKKYFDPISDKHSIPSFEIIRLACFYGQKEIFKYVWNEGGGKYCTDFLKQFLDDACQSGNLELVQILILLGAKPCSSSIMLAWGSGNIQLVEYITRMYEFDHELQENIWDRGFSSACLNGRINVVEMIMKTKSLTEDAIVKGCGVAIDFGHSDVLKTIFTLNKSVSTHMMNSQRIGLVDLCLKANDFELFSTLMNFYKDLNVLIDGLNFERYQIVCLMNFGITFEYLNIATGKGDLIKCVTSCLRDRQSVTDLVMKFLNNLLLRDIILYCIFPYVNYIYIT